jgi:hypothetical protein
MEMPDFPLALSAYPNVSPQMLKAAHMRFINMRATFNYRSYDRCESELVKDKTIAPEAKLDSSGGVEEDLEKYHRYERNQVLKFLFSKSFKSNGELSDMAKSGAIYRMYRQWILLALKPEAKKPGSRAYSMATDELRRLLSEAEANVAQYVNHQPGSSIGKSDKDLKERMSAIVATPDISEDTLPLLLSFDLEGFSPKQHPQFKVRAYSTWSEVFNDESFDATLDIFTRTTLRFSKMGVDDSMQMMGNDLEGFNGKVNTAAHIDLMGYAVFKLKEMGLSAGTSLLEVFMDDGLLRLNVDKRDYAEKANECIDVIDKVYQFAGQKISWDKTFASQILAQYLNRVFYDGIEVTPGAKAFMRIGKKQEVAIPTLPDELMAHASATRGAIQSGAEHWLAYYAYIFECYKSLRRWGLKTFKEDNLMRLAFAMYVPVGLGGFGLSSLYGLSTNESFNSMQAGIAAMKMICSSFQGFTAMANVYINSGVRDMSNAAVLQNPCAFRTRLRCLNMRRFANAAKRVVVRDSTNRIIAAVRRGDFTKADEAFEVIMAKTKDISEIQRKHLYDMTVMSYVDSVVGKLQSSTTALSLLGRRISTAIFIANRSESRMLIHETLIGRLAVRYL